MPTSVPLRVAHSFSKPFICESCRFKLLSRSPTAVRRTFSESHSIRHKLQTRLELPDFVPIPGTRKSGIDDSAAEPAASSGEHGEESASSEDGSSNDEVDVEDDAGNQKPRRSAWKKDTKEESFKEAKILPLSTKKHALRPINVTQPPVPRLAHGLDRVLFNAGLYQLRDVRTRVYNFDPYLEKLMPVNEFDFKTVSNFRPPSKDPVLARLAKEYKLKYVASTSSMTGVLKQFHYLLSDSRPLKFDNVSHGFGFSLNKKLTAIQYIPEAVFLRKHDNIYAVDADKELDSANILSMMGKYMEKLLTIDKETFEKHRIGKSHELDPKQFNQEDSFHYSSYESFLLRSQLDAHDPRLPGAGMFDLKTRAVLPVRMDTSDFVWGMDYEIRSIRGDFESFEREYYDMIRSTLLKYSLQVRLGRMDGIFVAYHNIARIFGFQYIPLEEMDMALHGQENRALGDQELLFSLKLMNEVYDRATKEFPDTSIRLHFETRGSSKHMTIFAEPVTEDEANKIQSTTKAAIEEWETAIQQTDDIRTYSREAYNKSLVDKHGVDIDQELTSGFMPKIGAEVAKHNEQTRNDSTKPADSNSEEIDLEVEEGNFDELLAKKEARATKRAEEEAAHMPKGPILAMTLEVESEVNEEEVDRPENLKPSDTWSMRWKFADLSEERARKFYATMRLRRLKAYEAAHRDTNSKEYFLRVLRRVAERGRSYREAIDKLDAGQSQTQYKPLGEEMSDEWPSLKRTGEMSQTVVAAVKTLIMRDGSFADVRPFMDGRWDLHIQIPWTDHDDKDPKSPSDTAHSQDPGKVEGKSKLPEYLPVRQWIWWHLRVWEKKMRQGASDATLHTRTAAQRTRHEDTIMSSLIKSTTASIREMKDRGMLESKIAHESKRLHDMQPKQSHEQDSPEMQDNAQPSSDKPSAASKDQAKASATHTKGKGEKGEEARTATSSERPSRRKRRPHRRTKQQKREAVKIAAAKSDAQTEAAAPQEKATEP